MQAAMMLYFLINLGSFTQSSTQASVQAFASTYGKTAQEVQTAYVGIIKQGSGNVITRYKEGKVTRQALREAILDSLKIARDDALYNDEQKFAAAWNSVSKISESTLEDLKEVHREIEEARKKGTQATLLIIGRTNALNFSAIEEQLQKAGSPWAPLKEKAECFLSFEHQTLDLSEKVSDFIKKNAGAADPVKVVSFLNTKGATQDEPESGLAGELNQKMLRGLQEKGYKVAEIDATFDSHAIKNQLSGMPEHKSHSTARPH